MSGHRPTCACGAVPVGPLGCCATCEDELRAILLPASKDAVLTQIAVAASGHPENRTLTMIARLARHGVTLKG